MTVRMRHTRGHTNNRRSHHQIMSPRLTKDVETGAIHERHRVSQETGVYRGRQIFNAEKIIARNTARKEAKKDTQE
jgi:ribosomal protein L32